MDIASRKEDDELAMDLAAARHGRADAKFGPGKRVGSAAAIDRIGQRQNRCRFSQLGMTRTKQKGWAAEVSRLPLSARIEFGGGPYDGTGGANDCRVGGQEWLRVSFALPIW